MVVMRLWLLSNSSSYTCNTVSFTACEFYLAKADWMEKAMAPHSSTLAWKIPWTEEPGVQQSMGSQKVGHD